MTPQSGEEAVEEEHDEDDKEGQQEAVADEDEHDEDEGGGAAILQEKHEEDEQMPPKRRKKMAAGEVEAFHKFNKHMCESDALLPSFSSDMRYALLTKNGLVHAIELYAGALT